ncbi:hypothetical protein DXX93_17675 [Thalassotalea euphylliae]|uniref:Lipocalin-like domain-containing protein n=1 Tax=Thalassotalea euphylliae TaxID=1655234 RepID=A0A3E0TU62_9GAMM|nr:hypothetical protein [Thalassotalea euphylliae]REL28216.1 hypothetical protein DXX93_17675 [Thalassotalea euphylliae]
MHDFVGKWRITEMELWSQDMVDMNEQGHFDFYQDNQGRFAFCAVEGWLDVRVSHRIPEMEFSWEGTDADHRVSGRGKIEFETPFVGYGKLFIHNGDESEFKIERMQVR